MPLPHRCRAASATLPRGHVDATSNAVTNARAVAAGRVAMRKATPSPTAMSGAGPQVIDAIKEKRSGSADLAQIASRRTERSVPQSAEA